MPGGLGGAGSERRIQAQAGDGDDAAAAQGVEKQQGQEGAVAHLHEVAPRQPAARLQGHLPSDLEQGLVPMASFQAGALGRNEGSQERQRPDPTRPGYGCEQHQAHPAQAAGLDEVGAGRTHRITVDPSGLDTAAPAQLDRVVERQHHGAVSDEGLDEQPKQDAGC